MGQALSVTWRREPWRSSARLGEVLGVVEHVDQHKRARWWLHVVLPGGARLSGRARSARGGERAAESVMRAAVALQGAGAFGPTGRAA